jgi:hypothetical protein
MKNITVTVDDEIYRQARIVAAERNQTVTALVREYLQSLQPAQASHEENVRRLFEALDQSRNTRSVGRLRREELYDRRVLR